MIAQAELDRIRSQKFPAIRFRSPLRPLTAAQADLRAMVLKQVVADPDSLDMNDWECEDATGCRTTRCLAGWAAHLAGIDTRMYLNAEQWEALGVSLLGLTEAEYDDEEDGELFYTSEYNATERMAKLSGITD